MKQVQLLVMDDKAADTGFFCCLHTHTAYWLLNCVLLCNCDKQLLWRALLNKVQLLEFVRFHCH